MDAFLIPLGNGPLQPSTDTTTRTNTKVHPITQYCRDFVRKLPQVDDSGVPYKLEPSAGGKKGRPKESTKEKYQSITQLERDLPSNPHYVTRPSERAKAHRPPHGLWDDFHMKLAREEFYVPAGLKIVLICPELYDRDILKDSSIHVKKSKTTSERDGLMTPCPHCKTNFYVRFKTWTKEELKLRLKQYFK